MSRVDHVVNSWRFGKRRNKCNFSSGVLSNCTGMEAATYFGNISKCFRFVYTRDPSHNACAREMSVFTHRGANEV
jgi:hypothetical protein